MADAFGDPFVAHSLETSLFFPSSRLLVRGNPKAAGTSLRWWLLETHGVDVAAATADSLWGESAPFQTVWDNHVDLRYTWRRLGEGERSDALTATDLLTVHPVRHPVTRAFAAWSSKYLTGEPYYEQRLPAGFSRLPERISGRDEVAQLFGRFVAELGAHVEAEGWPAVDVHFWPQHRLLAHPLGGQLLVLRQEQATTPLAVVTEWLVAHGVQPTPTQRLNENVVAYQAAFVEPAVSTLSHVYAEDFVAFDYEADAPAGAGDAVDLDWLNDVRGRNRRYGVVHAAAIRSRRRVAELERRLTQAQQRVEDLEASTSWRLTRPLRWSTERLRRDRR